MKTLFLIFLIGLTYKGKLYNDGIATYETNELDQDYAIEAKEGKHKDKHKHEMDRKIINIENFYTIKYKKYEIINTNFTLTQREREIFHSLTNGIPSNYTILAVGGWVRDKLTYNTPNDLDLLINCRTEGELKSVIEGIFLYLNLSNVENFTDVNYFRKPLPEDFRYGKALFTIYGVEIDIEIMASSRNIIFPFSFTPTDDFKLDAISRDTRVNGIGYDIRTNTVLDPVGGIKDLKNGELRPPNTQVPFGRDFFRIFSIFKTSAKSSLKIGKEFTRFIEESNDIIKSYLLYYRTERTCHKFRKITDDDTNEYSLRAFKLLMDSTIGDSFVPVQYLSYFAYNMTQYRNKIFNMAMVSEFVIKYVDMAQFKITEKQKHYIYNEIFYLAFQPKEETTFFYETFKKTKTQMNIVSHKTILTTAKRYCEYVDCKINVLKQLDLSILEAIILSIVNH